MKSCNENVTVLEESVAILESHGALKISVSLLVFQLVNSIGLKIWAYLKVRMRLMVIKSLFLNK